MRIQKLVVDNFVDNFSEKNFTVYKNFIFLQRQNNQNSKNNMIWKI